MANRGNANDDNASPTKPTGNHKVQKPSNRPDHIQQARSPQIPNDPPLCVASSKNYPVVSHEESNQEYEDTPRLTIANTMKGDRAYARRDDARGDIESRSLVSLLPDEERAVEDDNEKLKYTAGKNRTRVPRLVRLLAALSVFAMFHVSTTTILLAGDGDDHPYFVLPIPPRLEEGSASTNDKIVEAELLSISSNSCEVTTEARSPTGKSTRSSSSSKNKLVSVLIGEYDGAAYIGNALAAVWNQTYRPMEILVSLDDSPNVGESEFIVKIFQKDHPDANIHLYRQKDRLHWTANVNFLLTKSTGDYVSFLPVDDFIPPEYIAKLAECLDSDIEVVNCYPYLNKIDKRDTGKHLAKGRISQRSVAGPEHERVEQALTATSIVSFRGLVRRPSHGSFRPFLVPRLYKNFYLADKAQFVRQAIAGPTKEVDVRYDKLYRGDSVHNAMLKKNGNSSFSSGDFWEASVQLHTTLYDDTHSYTTSSLKAFELVSKGLTDYLGHWIGHQMDGRKSARQELSERISSKRRVAILGGGIQGCVMALMFRKHGYDVSLYDKSTDIMNRASATGEGKIHLGLVYSKDLTMKTGEHMMESALRFSSYLEYLIGKQIDWESLKSESFRYLIPFTSLVSPEEFEEYAERLGHIYERILMENPELSYLGLRPPNLISRRSNLHPMANESFFQAEYKSVEYALSPEGLKDVLKEALVVNSVKMVFGRKIVDVKRNHHTESSPKLGKLRVVTDVSEHDFDAVVNCLWEGRSAIDRQMGVQLNSGGNYRFKIGIKLPYMNEYGSLPSVTVVNGAFGDFVRYTKDRGMYFSYYPIARLGMTVNETEMMEWDRIADGIIPPELEKVQIDAHNEAFKNFFPGATVPFKCPRVGGGYILGNGHSDILDANTELHERADFPYVIDEGYISVSTQKLTSAPNNAHLLEKELFTAML